MGLEPRDGAMPKFAGSKLLSLGAVAFGVFLLLLSPTAGGHPQAAADGDIIPGRYIVVLKKSESPGAAAARHGLRPAFRGRRAR